MRRRVLTDTQVELVRAIAKQRRDTPTNAEIAAELGVSERLIDNLTGGYQYASEVKDYDEDAEFARLVNRETAPA